MAAYITLEGERREQDAAAEQINKAIQHLDQVLRYNVGASEEMASMECALYDTHALDSDDDYLSELIGQR